MTADDGSIVYRPAFSKGVVRLDAYLGAGASASNRAKLGLHRHAGKAWEFRSPLRAICRSEPPLSLLAASCSFAQTVSWVCCWRGRMGPRSLTAELAWRKTWHFVSSCRSTLVGTGCETMTSGAAMRVMRRWAGVWIGLTGAGKYGHAKNGFKRSRRTSDSGLTKVSNFGRTW